MLEPESKVIHGTENQNQPNLKFQKNLKTKNWFQFWKIEKLEHIL
jgi:hypothetical protein